MVRFTQARSRDVVVEVPDEADDEAALRKAQDLFFSQDDDQFKLRHISHLTTDNGKVLK